MKHTAFIFIGSVTVILALHMSTTRADDASFPCSKARTPVELRVCNSPYVTLKKSDRDLSRWYKRALATSTDVENLKINQRKWLDNLNSCLTSASPEPVQFVCNYVQDAKDKTLCYRDFCIFQEYAERIKILYAMPSAGKSGQYIVSEKWPSGIHESMITMEDENRPLCQYVESTIKSYGLLSAPLTEHNLFDRASSKAKVTWDPIPNDQMLSVALQLERKLRNTINPQTELLNSADFKKLISDRIASGEITIERAFEPALVHATLEKNEQKDTTILRYQRWSNSTKLSAMDFNQRIIFFRLDDRDVSKAQPIGTATNTFIFDQHVYFASTGGRGFDDNWRPLPIPQPELYVYDVWWYDSINTMLKTACHLLYEPQVEPKTH